MTRCDNQDRIPETSRYQDNIAATSITSITAPASADRGNKLSMNTGIVVLGAWQRLDTDVRFRKVEEGSAEIRRRAASGP